MKVWLSLPFLPTADLPRLVEVVERTGIEGVTLPEHVCVPAELGSAYPYAKDGQATLPVDTEFPDPLVLAGALGAVTNRLRFMTHVLLLPLRHPVSAAKEVATASVLAGGRLDLGVGVGWMREEFDALGVPFERRGRRLDEALPLLRRLWSGEVVEHAGEEFSFAPLAIRPVPAEHVSLFVGGHSPAALRRAARFGDGWVGVGPSVEELAELLPRLAEARREAGTHERPFAIRTGVKGRLDEARIEGVAALGVDALLVTPWQLAPAAAAHAITAEGVADGLGAFLDRFGPLLSASASQAER